MANLERYSLENEPKPETPLKEITLRFLKDYRASSEFKYHPSGNLNLTGDLSRLSGVFLQRALWSRALVEKLFELKSWEGTKALLDPWKSWSQTHSELYMKYYEDNEDEPSFDKRWRKFERQFAAVPIPKEIKNYQVHLSDKELRSHCHWEIFTLVDSIIESVGLLEEVAEPVSLETIFRAQRILEEPVFAKGGLKYELAKKPALKRVEYEGKNYFTFEIEREPAKSGWEDSSTDLDWERWNSLEVGKSVHYIYKKRGTAEKILQKGTIQGYEAMAAGDEMFLGPALSKVGVLVINETSHFYEIPLVRDIRLDNENIPTHDLEPDPVKPVDVSVINPETGERTNMILVNSEDVADEIVRQIRKIID